MSSRVAMAAAFGEGEGEGKGHQTLAALSRVSCLDQPRPAPVHQSLVTGRGASASARSGFLGWVGDEHNGRRVAASCDVVMVVSSPSNSPSKNSRRVRHRETGKQPVRSPARLPAGAVRPFLAACSLLRRGALFCTFRSIYMGRAWGRGQAPLTSPGLINTVSKMSVFPAAARRVIGRRARRPGYGSCRVRHDRSERQDCLAVSGRGWTGMRRPYEQRMPARAFPSLVPSRAPEVALRALPPRLASTSTPQ